MAFAFEAGRAGEIVGIDALTVAEFFPLGALGGVLPAGRMTAHRRVERRGQTRARGVVQRGRRRQELVGWRLKGDAGLAQLEELLFRVAHHLHADVPMPSALTTKAPPDFFDLLLEAVGVALQLRGPAAAPPGHPFTQLEGFFVP